MSWGNDEKDPQGGKIYSFWEAIVPRTFAMYHLKIRWRLKMDAVAPWLAQMILSTHTT